MGKPDVELLFHPPEKVRRMFEAVSSMIAEKEDLNAVTVQKITDRAGIGKGTAYSYFSSREELIVLALFYDYGKLIQELEVLMKQTENFQAKMYRIMDWVYQHGEHHMTFIHMVQMSIGSHKRLFELRDNDLKEVFGGLQDYMKIRGDAIMELGYQEGLYTETDVMRRRMAFATMVLLLAMTLGKKDEYSFFRMPYDEVREYAYQMMIKMLS